MKSLYPLGQPEKALGPEPQIDPWLTPYNRRACHFQKPIGVVATKIKMKLQRWNNTRLKGPQGKSEEPGASHGRQGLEVKKSLSLPVEGELFSLTFPFIDQAI